MGFLPASTIAHMGGFLACDPSRTFWHEAQSLLVLFKISCRSIRYNERDIMWLLRRACRLCWR
jgi:hypothetical protein